MAKIISKKQLIVINVCTVIGTIGNICYTIEDFQRGKIIEGWGDILSNFFLIGIAIYSNVKYFKEKYQD